MLVILTLNQGCRNNFDDHDIINYYTDPNSNKKRHYRVELILPVTTMLDETS